ncbi:cyclohydrolase [Multifurca ochricompacta]|uniref:GTP cyclohydrolase II n=1 Tax=Multifurca ochricompacta TaxID=376703 RepID=A0AAD4MCC8_9AGAM|nr:cyclohydrolase [Multifurca ochricompacta]
MTSLLTRTSDGLQLDPDAALLEALTSPTLSLKKDSFRRRDAELDPLLLAAAAASGPNVTRNHYAHDFFPGVGLPKAEGAWDWSKWDGERVGAINQPKKFVYTSKQGPRSLRTREGKENSGFDSDFARSLQSAPVNVPTGKRDRASSRSVAVPSPARPPQSDITTPIKVTCMARTRIPTPHGIAFLHLYHNNRDSKEHLAIVVDPAQFSDDDPSSSVPSIRSHSLDAVWSDSETEMDRLTRGAYLGRLSPTSQTASSPEYQKDLHTHTSGLVPPPLVRIHSECFTGETIGSMRCDCGEQLDEAIRLMSQPVMIPSNLPAEPPRRIPGRGVVVYMRQEGRGIGLLSKIRAYNLQDLGHDTVTANLMLGHGADERGYEVAIAILQDLGIGSSTGEGVRLLTNNPDKVRAMETEGLKIAERVPMIPRSWKKRQEDADVISISGSVERKVGATMVGGDAVHGEDLEKYLRTKVLRMGHMLQLHGV